MPTSADTQSYAPIENYCVMCVRWTLYFYDGDLPGTRVRLGHPAAAKAGYARFTCGECRQMSLAYPIERLIANESSSETS